MQTVLDFLAHLGIASLSPFWIPLLLWTLVAISVHLLLHSWEGGHPYVKYRSYQLLLVVLPLSLVLSSFPELSVLPDNVAQPVFVVTLSGPRVSQPSAGGLSPVFLLHMGVGLLSLIAVAGAAFRIILLAVHTAALGRFTRTVEIRPTEELLGVSYADLLQELVPGRAIRIGVTPDAITPMTAGILDPVIILPISMQADEAGTRMAIVHESVHVRRYDTLAHCIEEIIGAVFAVWPMVGVVRRQISVEREISCDVEVLGQPLISKKAYAQLIGRFALTHEPWIDLSLGMATSPNSLARRITAMKDRTFHTMSSSQTLYAGVGSAAAMLFALLFIVSCASLGGNKHKSGGAPATPSVTQTNQKSLPVTDDVFTVVDQMPQFPGGIDAMFTFMQNTTKYPEEAHKQGIEGKVFVRFVVEKDGQLDNIEVVHGIGGGCDEEAVRVLRLMPDWTPGKQGGVPVRVMFSMPFTFKL